MTDRILAILALITSGIILVTAIISLAIASVGYKRVGRVEHTVNNATDLLNERIDQLTDTITAHGIEIPSRSDLGKGEE